LHFASEGSVKSLKRLLELNSSLEFVNLVDNQGRTALDYALASQQPETEVLLRGVNANQGNSIQATIREVFEPLEEDSISLKADHPTQSAYGICCLNQYW
jgi:hypothetical protein